MVSWKEIYAAVAKVVTLTQETQKNKADIKQTREELNALAGEVKRLNQQMHDITLALQRVYYETLRLRDEVQRFQEDAEKRAADAARERENLVLRLENQLLRFERRLPSPRRTWTTEERLLN